MRIQDIIAKKRDGSFLEPDEIGFFVRAVTDHTIADEQAAALLMAIYLRGMDDDETTALTQAMALSGQVLSLTQHPTIDKHSTGGVGDKATLIVVPILMAAGAFVCKMSGRGLGHTGGTLDKLEAIPGFRVGLTPEEMVAQVNSIGACLAGQTSDLAPADKRLYALRDVTATVGSLPLIVSSILSKKLAGGAEAFVFDVKVGSGALMKTEAEAKSLARSLVAGSKLSGKRAVAVLSDMSQPLGRAVGNALEIREAIDVLTPGADTDVRLKELCLRLAAEGIALTKLTPDLETARTRAEELLESGAAKEAFRKIIVAQGGDGRVVDEPETILASAPIVRPVPALSEGHISAIDAQTVGEIVVALGGGRSRKEDVIDPAVGVMIAAPIGTHVTAGQPLAHVHAASEEAAEKAVARLQVVFGVSNEPTTPPPLVHEVL